MSAPWEVWAGRHGYIGWEPNPKLRVDGLTRYLRADLRCGDCEKCGKPECAMSMVANPATGMVLRPAPFFPACMEIMPKEAERVYVTLVKKAGKAPVE